MKQMKKSKRKKYWPYDLLHAICRAQVAARNTRCIEEKKIGKVPIEHKQNRSVPTFLSHRHCLKLRAGKSMLIDMTARWGSTVTQIKMRCPRSQESYFSEKEWVKLSEMMEILKCPHTATMALHKRNLTPG